MSTASDPVLGTICPFWRMSYKENFNADIKLRELSSELCGVWEIGDLGKSVRPAPQQACKALASTRLQCGW